MRRRNLILVLGISTASAAALLAALFASRGLWCAGDPPRETNLAAPLSAEAEADFAAALPEIDELRQHRGSLLAGTLLDDATASAAEGGDYIDLLLREARRLDSLAADHEDSREFSQADQLRAQAGRLRDEARQLDQAAQLSRGDRELDSERR